jgi:hypothetical protein
MNFQNVVKEHTFGRFIHNILKSVLLINPIQ